MVTNNILTNETQMKKYFAILLSFLALTACQPKDNHQSLEDQWRFALDPDDKGVKEQWYNQSLSDTIHLPGSLQEQGYGYDVGLETAWTGHVVDRTSRSSGRH